MPGPAPKPNPVRRNARAGPLQLPAEGRQGPAPKWPLGGRMPPMVRRLWRQVWATPQAQAWEQLGWTRTVARYCLVLLKAEQMNTNALAEARQLEDRLGLTPKAMRMLLWTVVMEEVGDRWAAQPVPDLRERLRAANAEES